MLINFYVATFIIAALPSFSQIKINEFMTGGKEDAKEEFVELYNASDSVVNLSGWKILYKSSSGKNETELFAFGKDFLLSPGEYFLVGSEEFPGKKNGKLKDNLSGTSGAIGLRNNKEILTESVAYGKVGVENVFIEKAPCDAPSKGTSMSRIPDGKDTDDNSSDFAKTKVATPGESNKSIISSIASTGQDEEVEIIQSSDNISINFTNASVNNDIAIFNTSGKLILQSNSNVNLDLSNYGPGVYLVKIITEDKVFSKKLLVK